MRNVVLASLFVILLTGPSTNAVSYSGVPNLGGLQLVAQLPSELLQRIKGFAYDGERFWAAIYLGRGRYATLDPTTFQWKVSDDEKQHKAISKVSGSFDSPGAVCFVNGKLWVAGAYGDSFGSIDTAHLGSRSHFQG